MKEFYRRNQSGAALAAAISLVLAAALTLAGCNQEELTPTVDSGGITLSVKGDSASSAQDTTKITFTFTQALTEPLEAGDIQATAGTGEVSLGDPVTQDDSEGKVWSIPVAVIKAGQVTLVISHPEVPDSESEKTVTVYLKAAEVEDVYWEAEQVGGKNGETASTGIQFTFDGKVTDLKPSEITITKYTGEVSWKKKAENLTKEDDYTWTLTLDEVVRPGAIKIKIAKDGIDTGAQKITVFNTTALFYTVTFRAIGGTPLETKVQTNANMKVTLPSKNPTRANAAFGGWNTKDDGTGMVFTANTEVKEDMTVYARWLINSNYDILIGQVEDLEKELIANMSGGTKDSPLSVAYVGGEDLAQLYNILDAYGKYVNLDLSGSSITDMTYAPTGTELGRSKVVELVLPDKLTVIRQGGSKNAPIFSGFSSLKKVTGKTVEYVGDYAFAEALSLTEVNFPVAVQVGDGAFEGCSQLAKVEFPKAQYVGNYAFRECSQLSSVSLPVALGLKDSVFQGCARLEEVNFPKVEAAGEALFKDCLNLKSVSMAKVTEIKTDTFTGCMTLEKAILPEVIKIGNQYFKDTQLATVELKVKTITAQTFYGTTTTLKSVTLPAVTEIGASFFKGYTALQTISLAAATKIGNYAFADCSKLATVSLPSVEAITDYAFQNCAELTEVSLDKAITIGKNAFENCGSLRTVTMPEVITIYDYAFRNCAALELAEDSLPVLKTIETGAFAACVRLTTVYLPVANSIGKGAFKDCAKLEKVTLMLVDTIKDSVFENCARLKTVNLPVAQSIGAKGFRNCDELTTLSLPMVETVGIEAFADCKELRAASLPILETIGERAFADCDALAAAGFIAVITVGKGAFENDPSLQTVDLTIAETIGDEAFYKCTGLKSLKLLSATSIGNKAFAECIELITIETDKVTTIGNEAFYHCKKLPSVSLPSAVTIGNKAFEMDLKLGSVNLPKAKTIGDSAFASCVSLKAVDFPLVTTVGNSAFAFVDEKGADFDYENGSLVSVNLPVVTTIGSSAFQRAIKLQFVGLARSMPTVGATLFAGIELDQTITVGVPGTYLANYISNTTWQDKFRGRGDDLLGQRNEHITLKFLDSAVVGTWANTEHKLVITSATTATLDNVPLFDDSVALYTESGKLVIKNNTGVIASATYKVDSDGKLIVSETTNAAKLPNGEYAK